MPKLPTPIEWITIAAAWLVACIVGCLIIAVFGPKDDPRPPRGRRDL